MDAINFVRKFSDRRLVGTTIDFFFVKTIILICIEQKRNTYDEN